MESTTLKNFTILFGITEALGALTLILVAAWLFYFREGFAWSSRPHIEFNWHPLLMVIGLIFLYGNGILVYRAFRNKRKRKLKIAHALIHLCAVLMTVMSLIAVFDSHNLAKPPIPNLYSLHSWLGIATVFLYCCQWLCGFITYLCPTVSTPIRVFYMPIHVYFGLLGFILAVTCCLTGLTEKALWAVSDYSSYSSEGLLVNFIGVSIVLFAGFVVYLTTELTYKRQPMPEDSMLLTANEERLPESPQKSETKVIDQ